MSNLMSLEIKRVTGRSSTLNFPLPAYAKDGDAGLDLAADFADWRIIWPGQIMLVPLGWAIAIPRGYVGLIRPRSSVARSGLVMASSGVIDSGYRGELGVPLLNTRPWPRLIRARQRVAQLLITPVANVLGFKRVDEFEPTERGDGGYGSTGS